MLDELVAFTFQHFYIFIWKGTKKCEQKKILPPKKNKQLRGNKMPLMKKAAANTFVNNPHLIIRRLTDIRCADDDWRLKTSQNDT